MTYFEMKIFMYVLVSGHVAPSQQIHHENKRRLPAISGPQVRTLLLYGRYYNEHYLDLQ